MVLGLHPNENKTMVTIDGKDRQCEKIGRTSFHKNCNPQVLVLAFDTYALNIYLRLNGNVIRGDNV